MNEGDPGRFIGDRYRIVRELGRGGMGVVYLGRDLRLDMDVAIKFRGISHSDATLWLKREFRAVASLRHPNLVELYELIAHERACYFTMEYLPGIDPRRWCAARSPTAPRPDEPVIADQSTLDARALQAARTEDTAVPLATAPTSVFARPVPLVEVARVRAVLAQLAEGLAFLHAHGVIHRDIKPSNVIVVGDNVKLLDFGLAIDERRQAGDLARETRLVGTAAYLAPEYVERLEVSPQMDVFALGVLGFELCTGEPPFGGTLHLRARLMQHVEVPRARALNPQIPEDLDDVLAAMLATDPAARPTAVEVAARLTGSLSQPRAVRRAPSFVGRAQELARIADRIADPSPRGRVVLITGPSGVGKTALIDEALGRARGPELLAWRGRCHERERLPYRAFDLIVDDLATELAGDPQLATGIEHAGALARVFPVLAPVLDLTLHEPPAADLRVERERALRALTQLFGTTLNTPRGVIAIDDLQWADEGSLELLAFLVEHVSRPLTLIASWTAEGTPSPTLQALLDRLGTAAEVLALPGLAPDELAQLIAELAPAAPTTRIATAVQLATGNPYLAEMLGRELGETDVADPHDAELRQLERLAPAERAVAEVAALAVGTASFEQLRAIAELPSERLSSVLRGLEHARVVRATPAPTGDPVYVVYHQRLREIASAAMTETARAEVHARFATWLERTTGDAAQLAYHWQQAGRPARAARWALAAADAAQAQLAWGLAADGYTRAIALGHDTLEVRAQLADCLLLGGKLAAAADAFLVLAELAERGETADAVTPGPAAGERARPPTPVEREGDRWRVRAAEAYLKLGELEPGLRLLDDVLARRGQPRTRARAQALARAATVAVRWLAPLPARRRPVDDVLAAAYRVIASFLSTPYPIESLEYVLRGVELAERGGDRAAYAMGMAMLSAYVATGSLGRYGDRAIAHAQRLAAESGAPYPRMVVAGATGMLATLRGHWTGMRAAHHEAEAVCRRLGLERSWEASFLRTYWALGEHYAGEPARALELLTRLADTSEDLWTRAMIGSFRGRVLVVAGQLDAAREVERALARTPAAQQGMSAIYLQVFQGELALAEHAWGRAQAIGRELARSARAQWLHTMPAISAMIDVITGTAELGRAVAGDRASAARVRAIARRLLGRGRASFYAVTALRLWGQAERVLGDRARSGRVLARAVKLAHERGGKIDQLALGALTGAVIAPGALGSAVTWSTGGMLRGEDGWHLR